MREGGWGWDWRMDWMSLKEEQGMGKDRDRFGREAVVRRRHGSHIETKHSLTLLCVWKEQQETAVYVPIMSQLRQGSSSLMISMFLFLNLVYIFFSFSPTHVLSILFFILYL